MFLNEHPFQIGIDLGGTKIELVVLDSNQKQVYRKRIDTQAYKGAEHILDQIATLYEPVKRIYSNHTLGVGTPGSLSQLTGLLRNSNTACLNGLALQQLIEDKLGHAVVCENDANCFAFAEALLGSGKGYECVFGVIIGTGCGGGWVFNKKIRTGPQRIAGEWGHTVLDPQGLECFCGQRGCVETFISGSGVERHYALTQPSNAKSKKCEEIFFLSSQTHAQANESYSDAIKVVDMFYSNMGQSLANLINTVDPDVVILGGGLSNIDGITQRATLEVKKRVFTSEFTTPILRHTLGDSAGVIGAALIGADLYDPTQADSQAQRSF